MDIQYGIAVKNKYDLFLDDDCDPFEILKSQEEEKLKSKTDKTKKDAKNEKAKSGKTKVPKTTATPVAVQPKGVDLNANKKEDQKPRGRGKPTEGGERTGSARPFRESGNREVDRPPRRERQDKERTDRPPAEFRDRSDRPESGRGRGRGERGVRGGRGGPRGAGGRGGFDRFGKREFERHSGSDKTGIKPVDKREGGGAHNWGTIKDDMEKEKQSGEPMNESVNEETTESPDTENQNPNAEPEEETPAEEEGPKEMTLDEWRAQQREERKQTQFNIRKPNEGADGGQWKKTFVLAKKPVEHESEEESDDEADDDHRQKKNLLNIEITFNDQPQRGRGGRRGRGGGGRGRGDGEREGRGGYGEREGRGGGYGEREGRGGGEREGRGGGRGGRGGEGGGRGFGPRGDRPARPERGSRDAAPHIEDENDFPSLGAK